MEMLYLTVFAASYWVLHATTKFIVASPVVNAAVSGVKFQTETKKITQSVLPVLPLVSILVMISDDGLRDNLLFNFIAVLICLVSGEFFFVNNEIRGNKLCFHSALMVGAVHLSVFIMAMMNVYLHLFQYICNSLLNG